MPDETLAESQPDAREARGLCPTCGDGHDAPTRKPWAVSVLPITPGDDKPRTLSVSKTDGSHVHESDAEWMREVLREANKRAGKPSAEALERVLSTMSHAMRKLLERPYCDARDMESHNRRFCGCPRHTAMRLVGYDGK